MLESDWTPRARPALVHQYQAVFGPPPMLTAPRYVPVPVLAPDQLLGRAPRAHEIPHLFKPVRQAVPTVLQPIQPLAPTRMHGRMLRAHEYPAIFKPAKFVTPAAPAVSGVGPVGATTLVLSLQPGTKTIYGWSTNVIPTHSGGEQRQSMFNLPRRRFEGNAFLVDSGSRDVRSAMQTGAAAGALFMLALPHEAMSISADSPNAVVTVVSTTSCDWTQPGQRVSIVGSTATVNAIIQSVTATTITVVTVDASWNFSFGVLGATGRAGGLIMPVVPVLLDPTQGFSRYPTRVDMWTLRAQAQTFGFGGVDAMGTGTSLVTYTAGVAVPVASVTDADLLIWDRPNAIEGTAQESMLSRSETVDLGALPFGIGDMTVPVWGRSLKLRSTSRADWQWFKAFVRHVRGRQSAFLLSTNRPDLIFDSTTGNGMKVKSSSVVGSGNYASWYTSAAHRRLAITFTDGTILYVTVTATPIDNGDGTLTLSLDTGFAGSVAKISFLEQVRFDRDDIEVTWSGAVFSVDEIVLAVQEAIITLPRVMIDTIITLNLIGSFPGVNEFALPAGGKSYLVRFSSDHSLTFGGISVVGGPIEGMVVTIECVNNNSFGLSLVHEEVTLTANHRLTNAASATRSSTNLHATYYYDSSTSRWLNIG